MRVLLLLVFSSLVAGDQSWSCNGPVVGQHGENRGELTTGALQVSARYEYLVEDEVYEADLGESITFELSGLSSTDSFVGFMFVASAGDVYPASSNAEAHSCAASSVISTSEAVETSAKAQWDLPDEAGVATITIYALTDDATWWASTYEFQVGEEEEEGAAGLRPAATAAAAAVLLLGLSA